MLPKGTLAPNSGNISSNMTRAQIIKTQNQYCGKSGVVYVTGSTGNTGFTGPTGPIGPTGSFSDVPELTAIIAVRTPLLTPYGPTGLNIGTERATSVNIGTNLIGINIGTTGSSFGIPVSINIGTAGKSNIALNGLSVNVSTKLTSPSYDAGGTGTTAMTIGSNLSSGSLTIGGGQTTGVLNIGTGTRSTTTGGLGAINIGTGSSTANVITVGSGTTSTVLNGTSVKATTKLITPILDCVTDAGTGNNSLVIGGTATAGNISLGAGQTTGVLNIGTGLRTITTGSGGGINIGTGSSTANPIIIGGVSSALTLGGASSTTMVGGTLTVNGNLTMGATGTIFTTLGQQIRLGYAHTQVAATTSLGPFFKSFGPVTLTSDTYDILYEGPNGLFTPTGLQGGGLLTIVIKSSSKMATLTYNVMNNGVVGFDSLTAISNVFGGWTTDPTIGAAGSTNNIRITFNAADWTSATVSWLFMGA